MVNVTNFNRLVGEGQKGKVLLMSMVACAATVMLWAGAGLYFYQAPAENVPPYADAMFVLAPTNDRISYAERLMDQGYAGTLALSVPPGEDDNRDGLPCNEKRAYLIVCFQPSPVTTQGEARAVQQLATANGWNSVNVVTDQSHAPRAGLIIERCYKGQLSIVAYRKDDLPLLSLTTPRDSWAFAYTYETAAFTKAAINQEC